jgi:hypothetical protein
VKRLSFEGFDGGEMNLSWKLLQQFQPSIHHNSLKTFQALSNVPIDIPFVNFKMPTSTAATISSPNFWILVFHWVLFSTLFNALSKLLHESSIEKPLSFYTPKHRVSFMKIKWKMLKSTFVKRVNYSNVSQQNPEHNKKTEREEKMFKQLLKSQTINELSLRWMLKSVHFTEYINHNSPKKRRQRKKISGKHEKKKTKAGEFWNKWCILILKWPWV